MLRKQEREFAQVNFGNFLALNRGCWGPIGAAGENYVIISPRLDGIQTGYNGNRIRVLRKQE